MASQQLQYRIGDIAQRKVTTQDPPRSGLVLLHVTFICQIPIGYLFPKESIACGGNATVWSTGSTRISAPPTTTHCRHFATVTITVSNPLTKTTIQYVVFMS
jgi:hypothetical protein